MANLQRENVTMFGKFLHSVWYVWASALGGKAGRSRFEADVVAMIRTVIALVYLVTNVIICMGVWRHWND